MHTVLPQRDVEVTGETGLRQRQPASKLLQTTEQGEADGGDGFGRCGFGRGGLGGLQLGAGWFAPFISGWNIKKSRTVDANSRSLANAID